MIKIWNDRRNRGFDDDDEIEYVNTGELCVKCGRYNDPVRIDCRCKYCGYSL